MTGDCGSAAMNPGLCKSSDLRALVTDGKISDALLYAIVLQMGFPEYQTYLLPSNAYNHMRQQNVESFKSISRDNIWVFAVPDDHGRMALLINWKTRSILHYTPSREELSMQSRRTLKVSLAILISYTDKPNVCDRSLWRGSNDCLA